MATTARQPTMDRVARIKLMHAELRRKRIHCLNKGTNVLSCPICGGTHSCHDGVRIGRRRCEGSERASNFAWGKTESDMLADGFLMLGVE
jgi:hypothetical protein